jgi:hypothetical protein
MNGLSTIKSINEWAAECKHREVMATVATKSNAAKRRKKKLGY